MNPFEDLSRRVDNMVAPPVDLEALVTSGERRLHRRRLAIAAAGAAAVAAVFAALAG